jgi:hypothetical protein
MGGLRVFVSRLLDLFRTRRLEESLDAELQAHLQLLSEENIRRGMAPQEAREAARRAFGGVEQTKEAYREQRGILLIDSVMQDFRFARRSAGGIWTDGAD